MKALQKPSSTKSKSRSSRKSARGILISFEGIDGSGKSTQAQMLREYLEECRYPLVFVREPGGVQIAEAVRAILLDGKHMAMNPRTELLLFLAARSELVDKVIQPSLRDGKIVISDRFSDSTFAYQISGRGLPAKEVKDLNRFAAASIKPDLTFLVDLPVQSAQTRLLKAKDRMESAEAAFHKRVRKGFLELAKSEPQRVKVLDGRHSKEEIWNVVRKQALALIYRRKLEPAR